MINIILSNSRILLYNSFFISYLNLLNQIINIINIIPNNINYLALSIIQIGINYFVSIIVTSPLIILINFIIVWNSFNVIYLTEGCLSNLKYFKLKITNNFIIIKTLTTNLSIKTFYITGLFSSCIHHEYNHNIGILIYY